MWNNYVDISEECEDLYCDELEKQVIDESFYNEVCINEGEIVVRSENIINVKFELSNNLTVIYEKGISPNKKIFHRLEISNDEGEILHNIKDSGEILTGGFETLTEDILAKVFTLIDEE